MKILRYQSSRRFGPYIKKELKLNYTREQLIKMSVDRLEAVLHRIRVNLSNRNVDSMIDSMLKTCSVGYETTMSQFYDISGFTQLLWSNPGWHDAIETYKCEKMMPQVPPGLQIAYIVATTTLAAHSLNESELVSPKESISKLNDNNESEDEIKQNNTFEIGQKI